MGIPKHIKKVRERIALKYISGTGIEIGALHCPLALPQVAHVKYVDRMNVSDLLKHYPELQNEELVEVEIIDDGEKLFKILDESQDFIVANHFLEHCEDPIGTLKTHFKKVKKDGIIYLAVPDKRNSFDHKRPSTPISHLIEDHCYGPKQSRWEHYVEWSKLVNGVENDLLLHQAQQLMEMKYSIHFHVWTMCEFVEFIEYVRRNLSLILI